VRLLRDCVICLGRPTCMWSLAASILVFDNCRRVMAEAGVNTDDQFGNWKRVWQKLEKLEMQISCFVLKKKYYMWHYGARRGRCLISELTLEAPIRTLLTFYRRRVICFI